MNTDHCTYRITWSAEDGEHLGLCAEFPSLSWPAAKPEDALSGIRAVVAECVRDMQAALEAIQPRRPQGKRQQTAPCANLTVGPWRRFPCPCPRGALGEGRSCFRDGG